MAQDRALSTTFFILKEFGPIGFLVKEDGESKEYKVLLGDPHTCTCPDFRISKDLCKHICWILLRRFRLPKDHEYCFQYGLTEGEILEILHGRHVIKPITTNNASNPYDHPHEEDGGVLQKHIDKDDICPICQEEFFLKRLPVTFCKFSCGNSVHISCMKVWADHQAVGDWQGMVRCPLCRENFDSVSQLNLQVKNASELVSNYEKDCLDKHLGIVCNGCRLCPIAGNCFRCMECSFFHLCEACYRRPTHPQHCFMVRMKRGQRWKMAASQSGEDKEKLDSMAASGPVIPSQVFKSLSVVKIQKESRLLNPGCQCRICLSGFQLNQYVRTLPCNHKFHSDCIDPLLRETNCCPLDGHVIYNPLTWNTKGAGKGSSSAHPGDTQSKCTEERMPDFFLKGIGLQVQKKNISVKTVTTEASVVRNSGSSTVKSEESVTPGFVDLSISGPNLSCLNVQSAFSRTHTE